MWDKVFWANNKKLKNKEAFPEDETHLKDLRVRNVFHQREVKTRSAKIKRLDEDRIVVSGHTGSYVSNTESQWVSDSFDGLKSLFEDNEDDGEWVFLVPELKGIEERKLYLKRCLLGRFCDEAGSQEDIANWATRVWKVPFGVKVSYLYDDVLLFLLRSEEEARRVLISGNRLKRGVFLDLSIWTPLMGTREAVKKKKKKLVDAVLHVAGLNPRSFRQFHSNGKAHRPGPDNIVDCELLCQRREENAVIGASESLVFFCFELVG
ncbi:hypothetical protein L1049_010781 [Liquidambar formosana]|uniref:DUF4283 domain-containing protein n=1 Tax=Liquidambar formosana TaxID=63359 RepID=A0AAP0R381_LIQFO